ncbi:MAG TPA: glycosyltransferase family 1 protein [Rhizomicrobium sp.]
MTKRIMYDGLNLGLRHGTGVATYTRVLVQLARELGHETGILYNRFRSMPKKRLDREIAFFDDPEPKGAAAVLRNVPLGLSCLTGFMGVQPTEIRPSGAVITRALGANWVASDRLYAAKNIFDRARGYFLLSGNLLDVRLPCKPDLFHWTYPLPMRGNARANIYTIHDVIPLRLPYTTLDWKRYYLDSMRAVIAKADHIVTVSENSKRDVMSLFDIEESRITNTFEAVSIPDAFVKRPIDSIADELAGAFGLDIGNYLLFYGSMEPKKNIGRVIQAYLAANIDMPLVIVVAQSWLAEDDTRLLKQMLREEDGTYQTKIRRYGYLPFPMLMTLVKGARAVLFPSLYEGFGLPILEAMTLGTPVITSTESSIPEVAGDAAIMVDPYDIDAIKAAIVSVSADTGLCKELAQKGLARAAHFSIENYRDRLGRLYASFL